MLNNTLQAIDQLGADLSIFIIGFVFGALAFRAKRKQYLKAKRESLTNRIILENRLG
jgi:hypothetical protein